MSADDVIAAWDQPGRTDAIHPTRAISEDAYWASGRAQADMLATVLPEGCRVVDFGCGDGRITIPLRALGYQTVGADASPNMLDALHQNDPDLPTVISRGPDLYEQLGKKTDAVVCLSVLIHHGYQDCLGILAGLRNTVRINGLLILDWPVSDQPTEAQDWLEVTTWSQTAQDDACVRIGLKRLESDLPWGVYKAVKAAG